jgi:spore germination cell wall hydrolase CwlJ-like protein
MLAKLTLTILLNLDCSARVIYAEARGEPQIGKIAVAEVIRNRAVKFSNICVTTLQPRQFRFAVKIQDATAYYDGILVTILAWGGPTNYVNKATHFYSGSKIPYWARGKRKQKIGNHNFVKLPYDY